MTRKAPLHFDRLAPAAKNGREQEVSPLTAHRAEKHLSCPVELGIASGER